MNSIGERLRQERLRRGFDLQQIAEATKINVALLEAIEANDLEKLPGIFFTRSFVRQYARALDLDDYDFEQELNRLAGCEEVPTHENDFVPREDIEVAPVAMPQSVSIRNSLSALAAFLLILALCSALFVLWQKARDRNAAAQGGASALDQPQAPPASEPLPPKAESTPPPSSAPPAQQPAVESAAPATPPPSRPAMSEAEKAAAAAAASAPVRVELRATQTVWLRVSADGSFLFSQILEPGQSRAVGANSLVQLKAGNAAGLEVMWNGKPVGALGEEGQVRNLEFRPDGFKILVALPPAKPPEPPPDGEL